jgi:prophage endopeptidase
MLNPYVLLTLVAVWAASLFGVGRWQNDAGHIAERGVWQARANAELASANAKILQLSAEVRATEQRHASELDQVAAEYEKEKAHVAAQTDFVIAGLRAGGLRLRDPYTPAIPAGGDPAGQATPATSGGNGGTGGELSEQTSEFLIGEASRADEIVKQLQACQAVVRSDRDLKGPAP